MTKEQIDKFSDNFLKKIKNGKIKGASVKGFS